MEDAHNFYEPYISKIYDDLFERGYVTLELYFTAFGPKTAKVLFELFGNLRTFKDAGKVIDIVWKSGEKDDNMADLGQSFAELFDLNIQLAYH